MLRKLPLLTPDNAPFWQGGASGVLNICHCNACSRFFHPPAPVCPHCRSFDVAPRAVSGLGEVLSFTINHQAWQPDLPVPFVVAIIELAEQRGLRLLSNIVGIAVDEVVIGMQVRVVFEQVEDVWLPLFVPAMAATLESQDQRLHG